MIDKNITIVEDESIVLMDLKDLVKSLGYTVSNIALSGEEAIDKAKINPPDLILMDIGLKGKVNGIEAARENWFFNKYSIKIKIMSIYEFKCKKCGKKFETLVSMREKDIFCPVCKSRDIQKCASSFGIGSDTKTSSSSTSCGSCSSNTCSICK